MKFGKTRLGKMVMEVLRTFLTKPATNLYPKEKLEMPDKFRGKIIFYPEKCIGCMLCMKDCPSNAIKITKLPDGKFEAEIDLDKCIYCAQCVDSCPRKALEATKDTELAQLDSGKLKVIFGAKPQEQPKK